MVSKWILNNCLAFATLTWLSLHLIPCSELTVRIIYLSWVLSARWINLVITFDFSKITALRCTRKCNTHEKLIRMRAFISKWYLWGPQLYDSILMNLTQSSMDRAALHNPFGLFLSARLHFKEGVKTEPIITKGNQAIWHTDQWPPWLMGLLSRWTAP